MARAFDPGTATSAVGIAAPDAEAVLIPPLAARLAIEAPGLRLSVVPLGRTAAIEALSECRADIAVGFIWNESDSIRRETLYDGGFLVAGSPASALPKAPRLTLDAYCAATHVLVSPGGDLRGIVDETLGRMVDPAE